MDKSAKPNGKSAAADSDSVALPKRGRGRPCKTLDELNDGNRRQALLSAAAKLFRRKSFDGATTRDIAVAVGMHSGSSYYHFKSKRALLFAVMEEGLRRGIARQNLVINNLTVPANPLGKSRQAAPDPRALLTDLVRNHLDILLYKERDFSSVMLFEWRSLTLRQRQQIGALQDEYESVWMSVLRTLHDAGQLGCEVKLARLLLFGALNWTARWFEPPQATQGGLTLDDVAAATVALLLGKRGRTATKVFP